MNIKEATRAMQLIELYSLICSHGEVVQYGEKLYQNYHGNWLLLDYTDIKPLTKEQIKLKQRK